MDEPLVRAEADDEADDDLLELIRPGSESSSESDDDCGGKGSGLLKKAGVCRTGCGEWIWPKGLYGLN